MIKILLADPGDVVRILTALHAVAASDPDADGYAQLAEEIGRQADKLPTPAGAP